MNFWRNPWVQLSALTAFLCVIGSHALKLEFCVIDYDIGWHLKVGDWIVGHLAVPRTGILSPSGADRSWVAYSRVMKSCCRVPTYENEGI